jgi:DNA-damage-inducible protein D
MNRKDRRGRIVQRMSSASYLEAARIACFNSGQRVEDHFVGVTEMIGIGKGGQRAVQTVMMSCYACYLVIQNVVR